MVFLINETFKRRKKKHSAARQIRQTFNFLNFFIFNSEKKILNLLRKFQTYKFNKSSLITTFPSLFMSVIASLLVFPRFVEKLISALILNHFIEFGFKSLAIVRIPRFAIGIAKGPIPQHKSTQTDFSSISSDII